MALVDANDQARAGGSFLGHFVEWGSLETGDLVVVGLRMHEREKKFEMGFEVARVETRILRTVRAKPFSD